MRTGSERSDKSIVTLTYVQRNALAVLAAEQPRDRRASRSTKDGALRTGAVMAARAGRCGDRRGVMTAGCCGRRASGRQRPPMRTPPPPMRAGRRIPGRPSLTEVARPGMSDRNHPEPLDVGNDARQVDTRPVVGAQQERVPLGDAAQCFGQAVGRGASPCRRPAGASGSLLTSSADCISQRTGSSASSMRNRPSAWRAPKKAGVMSSSTMGRWSMAREIASRQLLPPRRSSRSRNT
jgi:hypothetical protein